MRSIQKYQTLFFDCDGVILNSNPIKSEGFLEVTRPYGEEAAMRLLQFHKENGGISRFKKFKIFFEEMVECSDPKGEADRAVEAYGDFVRSRLLTCPTTEGFEEFLAILPKVPRFVVSGGKESELREVFAERGLDRHFDEIYGSPLKKTEIVQNLIDEGRVRLPALFIGDSRYDHKTAKEFGFDFVFLKKYTEFSDWREYFTPFPEARIVSSFVDLLKES